MNITFTRRVRTSLEFDFYVLTGKWPSGPRIFLFPRLCWERLMCLTLTRRQMEFIHDTVWLIGSIADNCLKIAMVLLVAYETFNVASAFLPGGPVSRILAGLQ